MFKLPASCALYVGANRIFVYISFIAVGSMLLNFCYKDTQKTEKLIKNTGLNLCFFMQKMGLKIFAFYSLTTRFCGGRIGEV